ncbi:transposase [Streptomyces sp. ID38640]|nr:transposase [Streptomyces sp. ID38640]
MSRLPARTGTRHTIPEKADSRAAPPAQGLTRWAPPGFDEERYTKRNTVERAINKLKNSRAAATRYDKRGYVHLGAITAAALVIWLRRWSPGQVLVGAAGDGRAPATRRRPARSRPRRRAARPVRGCRADHGRRCRGSGR